MATRYDYARELIDDLVPSIKAQGYRVFIAERGTYGFYTDQEGSKVISFKADLGNISFSGNYKTNNPKSTGTGWRISDSDKGNYEQMFNSFPPSWAVAGCSKWKYTTLDQHLDDYQKSSKYVEVPTRPRGAVVTYPLENY